LDEKIKSLVPALKAVAELIRQNNLHGFILGGIAAGFLGESRFTADVDAMILWEDLDLAWLIEKAERVGLRPRKPNPEAFARRTKMLLLVHTASGVNVDLSLGLTPFEVEAVQGSRIIDVEDFSFRIPSPEDLIILKAIANRPQDRLDIERVLQVHPEVDRKRILKWVKDYAQVLETPELVSSIEQLLKGARTKKSASLLNSSVASKKGKKK
jgi:hypothetical protein